MKPYNDIVNLYYVDIDNGRILETVKMREFYEWDIKRKAYVCVRSYALDMENIVNPNFENNKK